MSWPSSNYPQSHPPPIVKSSFDYRHGSSGSTYGVHDYDRQRYSLRGYDKDRYSLGAYDKERSKAPVDSSSHWKGGGNTAGAPLPVAHSHSYDWKGSTGSTSEHASSKFQSVRPNDSGHMSNYQDVRHSEVGHSSSYHNIKQSETGHSSSSFLNAKNHNEEYLNSFHINKPSESHSSSAFDWNKDLLPVKESMERILNASKGMMLNAMLPGVSSSQMPNLAAIVASSNADDVGPSSSKSYGGTQREKSSKAFDYLKSWRVKMNMPTDSFMVEKEIETRSQNSGKGSSADQKPSQIHHLDWKKDFSGSESVSRSYSGAPITMTDFAKLANDKLKELGSHPEMSENRKSSSNGDKRPDGNDLMEWQLKVLEKRNLVSLLTSGKDPYSLIESKKASPHSVDAHHYPKSKYQGMDEYYDADGKLTVNYPRKYPREAEKYKGRHNESPQRHSPGRRGRRSRTPTREEPSVSHGKTKPPFKHTRSMAAYAWGTLESQREKSPGPSKGWSYERSPGPSRGRSPRPVRARSPVHSRGRSPTSTRRRSPDPRRRSPGVSRGRSPGFKRGRSITPPRRWSPEATRMRSPVTRGRSPHLSRGRSPGLVRGRSPIPVRSRSPVSVRRRSPESLRRRSPGIIRGRSPSPVRRSLDLIRGRSPGQARRLSPKWSPGRMRERSRSPLYISRKKSMSPVFRGSPRLGSRGRSPHHYPRGRSPRPSSRQKSISPYSRERRLTRERSPRLYRGDSLRSLSHERSTPPLRRGSERSLSRERFAQLSRALLWGSSDKEKSPVRLPKHLADRMGSPILPKSIPSKGTSRHTEGYSQAQVPLREHSPMFEELSPSPEPEVNRRETFSPKQRNWSPASLHRGCSPVSAHTALDSPTQSEYRVVSSISSDSHSENRKTVNYPDNLPKGCSPISVEGSYARSESNSKLHQDLSPMRGVSPESVDLPPKSDDETPRRRSSHEGSRGSSQEKEDDELGKDKSQENEDLRIHLLRLREQKVELKLKKLEEESIETELKLLELKKKKSGDEFRASKRYGDDSPKHRKRDGRY